MNQIKDIIIIYIIIMSNLTIPFYQRLKPQDGEIVSVTFTEHKDSYIDGILNEYNCRLFLNHSDATKKRKVSSWNQIVPLNKPTVAKVENSSYGNSTETGEQIVQISLTYIRDENNDTLAEQFTKNTMLISFFKKLAYYSKIDINLLWEDVMYKIDEQRFNEQDDRPNLFDYCNIKRDTVVIDAFKQKDYNILYNIFIEQLDKAIREKPQKIVSQIEIISNGGVQNTINLIKKAVNTIKFPYTMKYTTAPIFQFETMSDTSSKEDHQKFIQFLIQEGQKMDPKTFVR